MSVLKKIILTVVLVVLLLFVQSYVFSDSCSLTVNSPSLKVIPFGCVGDECNFILFNSSDATSPSLDTCLEGCSNFYSPQNIECAQACVDEYVPSPTDVSLTSNLSFTKSSCQENTKVNVLLGSNLKMEITSTTTSLKISGIDSLNTNGKNIDIFVNNNDKLGNATFTFDFNNLVVSKTSKIEMRTKERSYCVSWAEGDLVYIKEDLTFNFNNLIVLEGSALDLTVEAKKPTGICDPGRSGGSVYVDNNAIYNYGTLNILLKSADSGKGKTAPKCTGNNRTNSPPAHGVNAGNAGEVKFILDKIMNNGSLDLKIISGDGADGGNGSSSKRSSPDNCASRNLPGNGGNGGDGGHISFFIKDTIDNTQLLSINLLAGKGGLGGNTGFDGGSRKDEAKGGNGGYGGNIFFCNTVWDSQFNKLVCNNDFKQIGSINNSGILNINSLAGKGNDGGRKNNYPDESKAGNGGDGGSLLSNLDIGILNNIGNININLESNVHGLKGTINGFNGVSGVTKNVFIDYLINKTNNFNLVVNSKRLPDPNESDVVIQKLQTGSYLPFKVYTILSSSSTINYDNECMNECQENRLCKESDDNELTCTPEQLAEDDLIYNSCINSCITYNEDGITGDTTNRKIKVNNACYIKKPSQNLDYLSGNISINLANQGEVQGFLPPSTNYTQNAECSICDYYDFESTAVFPTGSANKFSQTYTLFSSKQGTINANNLKIYYARNNSAFTKINNLYNPFTKENHLPLYTNKATISGVLNEKLNLYEYKLNLNNLEWYYDINMDLTGKDIFCYYQNYRIEGSIDGTSFNFPFTPLFKK